MVERVPMGAFVRKFYEQARRGLRQAMGLRVGLTATDCLSTDVCAAKAQVDWPCDVAELFFATKDHLVHKWAHYLPIYDKLFRPYRNTPVRMLEIGVSEGGSLDMWRRYFGPDATIFGVDVDLECVNGVTHPNQVRIGSQDDPAFLRSVVAELGVPDIILDDGSHLGRHQRASFDILFPLLADGGLYIIEDTHTAYWHWADGGYRRPDTAIEFAKSIVDDMHGWYHDRPTLTDAKTSIGGVTFHDSMIVIEKRQHSQPLNIRIGQSRRKGTA